MTEPCLGAIEVIVSRTVTRTRTQPDGSVVQYQAKIWNPTVGNMTLLSLGTSAPVIFLVIIGAVTTLDSEPDELGPSSVRARSPTQFAARAGSCWLRTHLAALCARAGPRTERRSRTPPAHCSARSACSARAVPHSHAAASPTAAAHASLGSPRPDAPFDALLTPRGALAARAARPNRV